MSALQLITSFWASLSLVPFMRRLSLTASCSFGCVTYQPVESLDVDEAQHVTQLEVLACDDLMQ